MAARRPAGAGDTAGSIRQEAVRLFFEHGYEATSLRSIAAAVGIKVGSLYHHIASKEDLLAEVMGAVMDDLLRQQTSALGTEGDVVDRLIAVLSCHVRFHATRARDVFVGNSELKSLSPLARRAILEKRSDYESRIRCLIGEAGQLREAVVINSRLHTYGILARGIHVASWYRPEGSLSLEQIVEIYAKAVLRELGVPCADARVDRRLLAAPARPLRSFSTKGRP